MKRSGQHKFLEYSFVQAAVFHPFRLSITCARINDNKSYKNLRLGCGYLVNDLKATTDTHSNAKIIIINYLSAGELFYYWINQGQCFVFVDFFTCLYQSFDCKKTKTYYHYQVYIFISECKQKKKKIKKEL